jgi:hypothetical protein
VTKGSQWLFTLAQPFCNLLEYLVINAKKFQNFRKPDLGAVEKKSYPLSPGADIVHVGPEQRQRIPVYSIMDCR